MENREIRKKNAKIVMIIAIVLQVAVFLVSMAFNVLFFIGAAGAAVGIYDGLENYQDYYYDEAIYDEALQEIMYDDFFALYDTGMNEDQIYSASVIFNECGIYDVYDVEFMYTQGSLKRFSMESDTGEPIEIYINMANEIFQLSTNDEVLYQDGEYY